MSWSQFWDTDGRGPREGQDAIRGGELAAPVTARGAADLCGSTEPISVSTVERVARQGAEDERPSAGGPSAAGATERRATPLQVIHQAGGREPTHCLIDVMAELEVGGVQLGVLWLDRSPEFAADRVRTRDFLQTQAEEVSSISRHCEEQIRAGRHPLVVISGPDPSAEWKGVIRSICEQRVPVSLVLTEEVEGSRTEREHRAGAPGWNFLEFQKLPHALGMVPCHRRELSEMLRLATTLRGPSLIVLRSGFPAADEFSPPGCAGVGGCAQLTAGSDLTLLAWGPSVGVAIAAAELLAQEGVSARIINGRFFNPIDTSGIREACRETNGLVILDEPQGGLGAVVLESLAKDGLTTPVRVLGLSQPVGSPREAADRRHHDGQIASKVVEFLDKIRPPGGVEIATGAQACQSLGSVRLVSHPALCPDRIERECRLIRTRRFSPDVERWISIYERFGERKRYMWQWSLHGIELTALPCVRADLRAHVNDTKLLSIMLCVFLDDVADRPGRDRLLQALLETGFEGLNAEPVDLPDGDRDYVRTTGELWREYQQRLGHYPCTEVFRDLLRYDLLQLFNTLQYSHLLNGQLRLLNVVEHDLYSPHNMMIISFATLDLMCSPEFRIDELGRLREAMWHAQCMGRIGNLLSTWRRELAEGDFTSGVFARAVAEGDLTVDELSSGDRARIERTIVERGHERHFLARWERHWESLRSAACRIESMDLNPLLEGHIRFLSTYLGSCGLV